MKRDFFKISLIVLFVFIVLPILAVADDVHHALDPVKVQPKVQPASVEAVAEEAVSKTITPELSRDIFYKKKAAQRAKKRVRRGVRAAKKRKKPVLKKISSLEGISISAIMFDIKAPTDSIAVINGRNVRVNNNVNGYKVAEINKKSVVFQKKMKLLELELEK